MAISWIRPFYEEEELFEFNLKYLFYVGLWPKEYLSKTQASIYKMYEVMLHILSFIYLVITGIGTYQHKDEITLFLSNLDKSLVAYNFVLKVVFFMWRRDQLRELINKVKHAGDIVTEERKQLMTTHVVFTTILGTAICGVFSALAQYKFEMTVEAWMPFDPMKNRMNLALAAQLLAIIFIVPCLYRSLAMQGIVCSLILYVCDQLIELKHKLKNLKYSPETETEMRNTFKEIVKKHVRLMGYSKEMNTVFKEFFLVQNLAITVELCLNAINVTVAGLEEKKVLASFLAFLAVALLNAYIYCYLGNEMIIQSEGIALAAYEAPWSSWPVDMQKNLLLLIRAAQKPFKLSAGGIAPMSIQTYSQLLRALHCPYFYVLANTYGVLKQEVMDANKPNIYSSQMDNDTPKFVSIKSTTWLWMAIPLSCFFIDLIWRIVVRNRSNAEILKVSLMAGRVLSITLACPHNSFNSRPGQYVLLQCPDISLLEWHPFTVVKVPTMNEKYFVVWIKVTGDWTEALENLLLERCYSVRILVDGPMASVMERVETCRVALCVAAGVGITPFVPILHQMLSAPRNNLPGRVHLIWIVRTEGEAAALADLSSQCLQQLREANRPDRLHLLIHITGSAENYTTTQTMVNKKGVTHVVNSENDAKITLLNQNFKETDKYKNRYQIAKDYPLLGCRITQGRPHWDRVFGYWVHLYPREHLTLFCCGPKKLVNTLRTKCKEVSHSTKTKFEFIHEKFS